MNARFHLERSVATFNTWAGQTLSWLVARGERRNEELAVPTRQMTACLGPQLPIALVLTFHPTMVQELAMGGASVVTLIGVWLCWGAPRYRMSLEERVKDGKMTDSDASRRILRSRWVGPTVTIIGVGLLTLAVAR